MKKPDRPKKQFDWIAQTANMAQLVAAWVPKIIAELKAKDERIRQLEASVRSLAERCCDQSELLSKRAERPNQANKGRGAKR